MLKLFCSTDKEFNSNGDKIIQPLKAQIYKQDNGDFYLDLETDLSFINDLKERAIIVAPTPQGEQAFRISNLKKNRKKIFIRAYHVFYDSKNYLVKDNNIVNKTCDNALKHLNNNTDVPSPFTVRSDVSTVASFRCVRHSLYEAVQTILERWGGHLVRDNFNIRIMSTIGQDNGVTIRYAKNLKDITSDENWDDVVTKVLPIGKDGILLNHLDKDADIYVNAPVQYEIPYTKKISFNQDISNENYKKDDGQVDELAYKRALIVDLKAQAQQYVARNCRPKVNYTLKANVERLTDVGDIVEVIDEKLGINVITQVISFKYDCILKQYQEVEFGNFRNRAANLVGYITSKCDDMVSQKVSEFHVQQSASTTQLADSVWNVLRDNKIIIDGNKIIVVDKLPKEQAKYVIMINSEGIHFSRTGIRGPFVNVWKIDGTLNMRSVNVINLTADLIKGGTFKLGGNLNANGCICVYDARNSMISRIDRDGIKVFGEAGAYISINSTEGIAGYDRMGCYFRVNNSAVHMKKSFIEEELTICNKVKIKSVVSAGANAHMTFNGVGLFAVPGGG